MITLITGGRASGKTTYLLKQVNNDKHCIGVYSKKVYKNDQVIGYNLVALPNQIEIPYIRKKKYLNECFNPTRETERFYFNEQAYNQVYAEIMYEVADAETIFIDEIGALELNNKAGFYTFLLQIINEYQEKNIYLTVNKKSVALLQQLLTNKQVPYNTIRVSQIGAIVLADKIEEAQLNKTIDIIIKADVFPEVLIISTDNDKLTACKIHWAIECVQTKEEVINKQQSIDLANTHIQGIDAWIVVDERDNVSQDAIRRIITEIKNKEK